MNDVSASQMHLKFLLLVNEVDAEETKLLYSPVLLYA